MSGNWIDLRGGVDGRSIRGVALAALLAPALCAAESTLGTNSATAHLSFKVVIPPVFRVLQVTPVANGYQYRVWTNTRSVMFNGREYRFNSVGESTLTVPASRDGIYIVHGL